MTSDSDILSFDEGHEDGFESGEAAAECSRSQTLWTCGSVLDTSDGGPYPEVGVLNVAADLGLVIGRNEDPS